jgi:hypothetical protein
MLEKTEGTITKWIIQRYRQHWAHKNKTNKNKHKAETKSNAYTLYKI